MLILPKWFILIMAIYMTGSFISFAPSVATEYWPQSKFFTVTLFIILVGGVLAMWHEVYLHYKKNKNY